VESLSGCAWNGCPSQRGIRKVLQKCGEPVFRDLVGYSLGPNQRREYPIEEWVYGPNNGMLSILTFEGSRLRAIERRRSR